MVLNTHHTLRDGDARQTGTVIERRVSNARHTLRNADARQAGADRERIVSNARYALWNSDVRQAGAARERIVSNVCQTIRQADRCDLTAISIPRDIGAIVVIRHSTSTDDSQKSCAIQSPCQIIAARAACNRIVCDGHTAVSAAAVYEVVCRLQKHLERSGA